MRISILLPHWKTGHMTAYTLAKLLEYKGKHEIQIFVINNNSGDGSEAYLKPFMDNIKYFEYPKDRLQSHGCAFDWVMPHVTTEYFMTIESDSFPTKDNWLDYYEYLIEQGNDCAGSILTLSGGSYMHPAGALYKRSVWQEAKNYCDKIEYSYFPNMSNRSGFDCHLMVHNSIVDDVIAAPEDYMELAKNYKGLTKEEILAKRDYYLPVVAPFHNGMGTKQEAFLTYAQRNIQSESPHTILDNRQKLINRMGAEPGQWLTYYMVATGKLMAVIPTEIKWMPNRGGQQQEYTLMENGFKHLWSVSAYFENENQEFQDIVVPKRKQVEELYNSLPNHYKI